MEEKEAIPEFDVDKENIKTIIDKLSADLNSQRNFINYLNQNIIRANSGSQESAKKVKKINNILSDIIESLGLPFSDLIINSKEIIHYYCEKFVENENSDNIKSILINIIKIFNFKSAFNPSDSLKQFLKNSNMEIKGLPVNERDGNDINEIENLYNEISIPFNTINEVEENTKKIIINEKLEKINEIEKKNLYPKAMIEFLKEKLKNREFIKNGKKISKLCSQTSDQNHSQIKYYPNIDYNLIYKELKELRKKPIKNRTFFYKNENLAEGEDEFTEFKNYFYPLDEDQEKEIKRQYCGFLNSNGGRIYIGIKDERIVKGIELTYKEEDSFRNTLVSYGNEFYPKCRLDKIKVHFIPIKNMFTKKFIDNYYVVKIIVLPGDHFKLYSMTSKGYNSAKRLQGQSINLTADEIEKEIIERTLSKLNSSYIQSQINYEEFNDPQPEINLDYNFDSDKFKNIEGNEIKEKKGKMQHVNIKKIENKIKKNVQYIIIIKNIDIKLKVKDINKYFNGLGCSQQKFPKKEGKSTGIGKLVFTNEEAAKNVINRLNGNTLGGHRKIKMTLKKFTYFKKVVNKKWK